MQNQFGNHNLILFTNRDTLKNICSKYCKTALDSSSEIVLILTYYESVKDWLMYLKDNGISVEKYKNDGSLVVIESKKGFFGLLNDFVGIMIMIRMLLGRANKLAKKGLTIISDIVFQREYYEQDLLSSCGRGHSRNCWYCDHVQCGARRREFTDDDSPRCSMVVRCDSYYCGIWRCCASYQYRKNSRISLHVFWDNLDFHHASCDFQYLLQEKI